MESLLVRIDHFHDRKLYVSTVKTWFEELGVATGRLVTMGEFHLLFIEATPAQNDAVLMHFATKNVDTNAKDEPCVDRFIDVVGRQPISMPTCKGFLEMNVLNASLLERLMVGDWHCEKAWLDDALSTPRSKALIKWKEDAKNARKDRRKRAAQDRDTERAAKKARADEEKAKLEAAKAEAGEDAEKEEGDEDAEETGKKLDEDANGDADSEKTAPSQKSQPSRPQETGRSKQQPQQQAKEQWKKKQPQSNGPPHHHKSKGSKPPHQHAGRTGGTQHSHKKA